MIVTTLIDVVLARRAALRRLNGALLAMSAKQQSGPSPSIVFVATEEQGIVGRATRRLVAQMEQGATLPAAAQAHPSALPREALAFISVGEVIGSQAAALDEMDGSEDPKLTSLWRSCIDRTVYIAGVMLALVMVATFMMIVIIPQFQAIFAEFELQLPTVTLLVVSASNFTVAHWYIFAAPIVCVLPAAVVIALLYLCDVRVLQPLADRVFRSRRVAELFRLLAMAAEARHAFAPVLARLSNTYPAASLRRRLRQVDEDVAAGADWRDAMLRARLLRPAENALLGTAQAVGNLPWALRTIATRRERRLAYRFAAFAHVAYPAIIIVLGACVGLFVVAMFLPLVRLIMGLV